MDTFFYINVLYSSVMEAPKFSKTIEDLSAVEGHEARFTCEVTGLPDLQAQDLKRGYGIL
jgi:hypothetical protein